MGNIKEIIREEIEKYHNEKEEKENKEMLEEANKNSILVAKTLAYGIGFMLLFLFFMNFEVYLQNVNVMGMFILVPYGLGSFIMYQIVKNKATSEAEAKGQAAMMMVPALLYLVATITMLVYSAF